MWSKRYWSIRYWAGRYWPKATTGVTPTPTPDGSVCVEAGGAFVLGSLVTCSAYTIEPLAGGIYAITAANIATDVLGASAGGQYVIGQAVKGLANCDC